VTAAPRGCASRRSRSHTAAPRPRGQGGIEVAGVGPDPGPAADLRRHRGEGPRQQPTGVRSDVGVAGDQVRGQRQFGLRPAGQVDPAGPDPCVVPPDSLLGLAVDLDVAGVQVDRCRRVTQHQRRPDLRRDRPQPAGVELRQGGLDPGQLRRSEPAGEPGGGPARRHRRLCQPRTAAVGPDPVQAVQAVLTDQLRARHPHQQLAAGRAPVALLDRADTPVEDLHDPQPANQLIDRGEPRQPGQRPVRGTDPDTTRTTLGRTLTTPLFLHRAGALPVGQDQVFATPILPT